MELDEETLAKMRGQVDWVDGPVRVPSNVPPEAVLKIKNNWLKRQSAQHELREAMKLWAGQYWHGLGETDSMIQRRFFLTFGIDTMTAQTLNAAKAEQLKEQIYGRLAT